MSVPKSGCRLLPDNAEMMVAEFESTGAEAIFVFHKSVDGNGTKPFRLAPFPVLMFPQDAPTVAGSTTMFRSVVADCAVGCVESVTVNTTAVVPTELCAGVPVIAPVEALIESPLGKLLALKVYGVVPPVAAIPPPYVLPAVPSGREVVVIVSVLGATTAAAIAMFKLAVAVCGVGWPASVTVTATDVVPTALCPGEPVIAPVE